MSSKNGWHIFAETLNKTIKDAHHTSKFSAQIMKNIYSEDANDEKKSMYNFWFKLKFLKNEVNFLQFVSDQCLGN